jgi:DNA-binding winged helix-turn-helix (wHTH) protein
MSAAMEPIHTRFGAFRLDEAEALLERDGQAVEIPPRAFQVLCELARRPGQLVTKNALLDAVWGHRHINESALKNIVSQLRQSLGDDARESQFIETAPRRGYRFIAPLGEPVAVRTTAIEAPPAPKASLQEPGDVVGRDRPLAQLHTAWGAAQRGQRQLVFVLGDAGVGKSTLIERFVAESGARVAFGQCIEHYGSGEPYMPVLEALNILCRTEGGDVVVRAMREAAPTWLLQLPWFVNDEDRRRLQRETAGATQDRMLREFGELVDRMPRDRPVLLVLEDLHWSDHATVQLLGYLAHRRGPAAFMVLGTLRPTELVLEDHPLAGLRLQLRTRRLCVELDLESLSEADMGAYLGARLGDGVPEAFVRALHAHTSGLPLFVVNVVDELVNAGSLRREAGSWRFPDAAALTVPHSVIALIETQIARLPAEHRRVLGAASVSGVEFLHVPLAEVLGLPVDSLHEMLGDASRRVSWLSATGAKPLADGRIASRYAFGHTMYRQVLYERLAPAQRLQWHRQWAAALASAYAGAAGEIAAELALHYERGGLAMAAAEQLAIVSARALERGAAHEAIAAARRALELGAGQLAKPQELELRVLDGVALTRLYVVADPQVAAAFDRALALRAEGAPAWPRALQGAWWVHFARGEMGPARSLAVQMLALVEHGDAGLRLAAHNAMGLVLMMAGELAPARVQLEAALDIHANEGMDLPPAQFVQDPGVEAMCALALVFWAGGEPRRARELVRRAAGLAAASRHALSEVTALTTGAILHSLAREFDNVFQLTQRLYAVIQEHALPTTQSDLGWLHGRALVARGQADEGLLLMRKAARSAEESGMRFGLCGYHTHHVSACLAVGLVEEAGASVDAGIALAERIGGHLVLPALLRQRAEMLVRDGDQQTAEAVLRRAITLARATGSAYFELLALATARGLGNPLADPARLAELLALYEGDPAPHLNEARAGAP